jgi:RNA polymerase sigma-70 factor (ECF subfamily)
VIEAQHLTSILRDESLVNAVNSLHPDIRETLLMFAIDEMSYVEVATALDVPLGTVRSRLGRARRAVREQTRDLMAIGDVPTRVDVKDDSDDA